MPATADPATPYVFISYASADRERVLEIVSALRQAGISCWLDQHDITGGTNWGGSIVNAIEGCAALVLLASTASLASRNVRQEIALAWRHTKPYLPLRLDTTPIPNDIAYWLETAQWVEVLQYPMETWLPKVTHALEPLTSSRNAATLPVAEPLAPPDHLSTMPSPPSSFVGREREVAEVAALLHVGRVVTLTGPGGTGKTRLAIAVGHRLAREYRHGVTFVDLAPLHDAALVLPTIAASFGMQDGGTRPILDAMIDVLHDRHVLIIADNVEQVIDAAVDLGRLLSRCPRLTLLATSREPLRITGEVEYAVAPLPLPEAGRDSDLARLRENPAVLLFVQRARAVRAGFDLTPENADTVAAICRRLEGLPLAVELAAARVRSLPVTPLLERLQQPLHLLSGGSRDLPARQQTIRDTIAWSYNLLSSEEQRLFRRLAVFAGRWTLETAEAVVAIDGDLGIDVLDGLVSLVEKSLVIQREEPGGILSYRFLVPVREFAAEQLGQHGEAVAVRRQHALAMLELSRHDFSYPRESPSGRWIESVESGYDDIRAALTWAADNDNLLGTEMLWPLGWYWILRGDLSEGMRWIRAFLARHEPRDVLRARALIVLSLLSWEQNDAESAAQAAVEALAIGRETGDAALIVEALAMRACSMTLGTGRNDNEVQAALSEALSLAEAQGLAGILPTILLAWADHDTRAGHYDRVEALSLRMKSATAFRGTAFGEASSSWCLGRIAALRDDKDASLRHCRDALIANRTASHAPFAVWTLELLATVLLRGGRSDPAVQLMAVSDRERRLKGLVATAWWQAYLADAEEARAHLEDEAFETAWQAGLTLTLIDGITLALEVTEA